eukprot:427544_1
MAVFYTKTDTNNMDNEDSDDGPMLQQALPVNTNLEIDETRPASTAEEYLLRVRLERQKLPKISHAQIDKTNLAKMNNESKTADETKLSKAKKSKHFNDYNKYFTQNTAQQNVNPLLLPNNKWKQKFVNSFKLQRDILIKNIVKPSKWRKKRKNLNDCEYLAYKHLNIPNHKHTDKWLKFALNYTDINNAKNNKNNDENSDIYPIPPLLSIMEQLSPIETETLLQTFMNFAIETHENNNDFGLNGIVCLWLYALMLRIELPLRADLTANIREFARFCIKERNKLKENESSELIVFTNMVIVIIEEVFKQPII